MTHVSTLWVVLQLINGCWFDICRECIVMTWKREPPVIWASVCVCWCCTKGHRHTFHWQELWTASGRQCLKPVEMQAHRLVALFNKASTGSFKKASTGSLLNHSIKNSRSLRFTQPSPASNQICLRPLSHFCQDSISTTGNLFKTGSELCTGHGQAFLSSLPPGPDRSWSYVIAFKNDLINININCQYIDYYQYFADLVLFLLQSNDDLMIHFSLICMFFLEKFQTDLVQAVCP